MMTDFLIGGIPVIASWGAVTEVQARTHRKSRINKKWLKRYGTKYVPSKDLIYFQGMIIGHPKTIEKLKKAVNKYGEKIFK